MNRGAVDVSAAGARTFGLLSDLIFSKIQAQNEIRGSAHWKPGEAGKAYSVPMLTYRSFRFVYGLQVGCVRLRHSPGFLHFPFFQIIHFNLLQIIWALLKKIHAFNSAKSILRVIECNEKSKLVFALGKASRRGVEGEKVACASCSVSAFLSSRTWQATFGSHEPSAAAIILKRWLHLDQVLQHKCGCLVGVTFN